MIYKMRKPQPLTKINFSSKHRRPKFTLRGVIIINILDYLNMQNLTLALQVRSKGQLSSRLSLSLLLIFDFLSNKQKFQDYKQTHGRKYGCKGVMQPQADISVIKNVYGI